MLGPPAPGEVIAFRACNAGTADVGQELANLRGSTVIVPKIYSTFLVPSESVSDFQIYVPKPPAVAPPAPPPVAKPTCLTCGGAP